MSVLSDKWIRKMSKEEDMISPFEEKQVRGDSISYGLSSFGYDARVSDEFKIFWIHYLRIHICTNLKFIRNSSVITKGR